MSKRHAAILDKLTAGVSDEFPCRKISNAPGHFLPVAIDRLGPRHFVVGHYIVKDGERLAAPAVEFVRLDRGWFPAALTDLDRFVRAMEVERSGWVVSFDRGEYGDLRPLAGAFLDEIKAQQGDLTPKAVGGKGGAR